MTPGMTMFPNTPIGVLGLGAVQSAPAEPWFQRLLDPNLIWAVIAILGLICWTTFAIVNAYHRHRERLAMIERGIHPDRDDSARP